MSNQYDLSKVLNLVEQRNEITLKLKMIERPSIILTTDEGKPIYKITMSHVGDLLIFVNTLEQHSIPAMLTRVPYPDDFYDLSDSEVSATYIEAAKILERHKGNVEVRATRSNQQVMEQEAIWRLIVGLPIEKCIPFAELMQDIFGDDIYNNKKAGEV